MPLIDQIEDFQATMNKVVELVEDTKGLAGQIPDTSIAEASAKMKVIFELCEAGIQTLKNAIDQAEDIQQTLGR